jgi:hypothetical protein
VGRKAGRHAVGRQVGTEADRQTDRQTDTQTDRQTERHTGRRGHSERTWTRQGKGCTSQADRQKDALHREENMEFVKADAETDTRAIIDRHYVVINVVY